MKILSSFLKNIIQHTVFVRYFLYYIERRCNINSGMENDLYHEGWSFIIITDGKNKKLLNSSIKSILDEFGEDRYEIIVIGQNRDYPQLNNKIRYIPYYSFPFLAGWITIKKNIGAKVAIYNKLVIMHDYVSLNRGWKVGFDEFGQDYDICMNRIKLKNGNRTRDWLVYDYPNLGPALLPYKIQCKKYQYISGTYFVVKKDFFIRNLLDEKLRWGEGEDVEWSKRVREKANIVFNNNSCVSYLKDKLPNDAPYCDNWIENTIKLYGMYSININKGNYAEDIAKY